MKKTMRIAAVVVGIAIGVAPALADTLLLKNGNRVTGYFEGGTARVVKFRGADGTVKDYDILQVQEVLFGETAATTAGSTAAPAATPAPAATVAPVTRGGTTPSPTTTTRTPAVSANPQLRPASERPPAQPPSATAANTAFTVPTGSKIAIHLVDAINSETNKVGSTFVAVLDEPLTVGGIEVVARGADIRGRISNINEAGRVAGAAELGLELTQIYVNGIPYAVTTSEYSEVGENRAGQTARRAGVGAGVGALIGAIAGGGKGAAIGAGVGAGAGTVAQVATKGEKLNIPSETRLEFTLRAPLVIAAK